MSRPVARVCLLGAESTGKTTLAAALAAAYGTVWNPEYGRVYTEVGRAGRRRGRARSSRTSPGCTAGTRTSSPAWPTGSLLGHRRVHHRRLPRGVPRRSGTRLRGPRRPPVRPLSRLRARRAVEADGLREFEEARRATTRSTSRTRERAARRGCCSRARTRRDSSGRGKPSTGCSSGGAGLPVAGAWCLARCDRGRAASTTVRYTADGDAGHDLLPNYSTLATRRWSGLRMRAGPTRLAATARPPAPGSERPATGRRGARRS